MSEALYEAHPSLIRSRPFGTVIAILLIPLFGIGLLVLLYWWLTMKMDHLVIKADEIVWTHGLLSKQYTEITMHSVRSVKVSQSFLQRLLSAGDVEIYTAGDDAELVVRGLPNPDRIRDLIKGQSNA